MTSSLNSQRDKLSVENEMMKKELVKNRSELESRRKVIEELNRSFKELDDDRKRTTELLINTKIALANKG